jgi:hypothetical protein
MTDRIPMGGAPSPHPRPDEHIGVNRDLKAVGTR